MATVDKKSCFYYETSPKIVPINKTSEITIKPVLRLPTEEKYTLYVTGMLDRKQSIYDVGLTDGALVFRHFFDREQEYSVRIYRRGETNIRTGWLSIVHLYCVEGDLYAMRPYKGDFHLHSQRSDGHESPAGVCALARQRGLDFYALTDHYRYNPSIEAIDTFEGLDIDAMILPGEEVHFHEGGHIVSFGGKYGIGEKYSEIKDKHPEIYQKELEAFEKNIQKDADTIADESLRKIYIKMRHALSEVKKARAIAILPHPFWIESAAHYHFADSVFEKLFSREIIDAFELMNGDDGDTNALQIAYWQQQRMQGNYVPIVSGTDSHTLIKDPHFPMFFTVILAKELNMESIQDAVANKRSVIVNMLCDDSQFRDTQEPMAYGEYRFVMFSLYLMREVFPLHDEICSEEGRLMKKYLAGDGKREKSTDQSQGRDWKIV